MEVVEGGVGVWVRVRAEGWRGGAICWGWWVVEGGWWGRCR